MTSTAPALIAELDAAIGTAPRARREKILRSVTDLFLDSELTFSAEQVALFDDVIHRLVDKEDAASLAKLGARLAASGYQLPLVFSKLALHEDIAVAGPVLELALGLPEEVLVEIAGKKPPKHLAAISRRNAITEKVTDILIERGSPDIAFKTAGNPKAQLSEMGFVKLINRAKTDKALASAIASRGDLPAELEPFLKLALG